MMRIENHWERIESWQDVIRVIREYYNEDLADRAEELILDMIDSFKERIDELSFWDYDDDADDWCDD